MHSDTTSANQILQTAKPAKRWRAILMSLAMHATILTVVLLLLARAPRGGGNAQPDRIGEIVLAVVNEEADVEYWEDPDTSEPEQSTASSPEISTAAPPPIEFTPPNIDLPGVAPVDVNDSADAMADQPTRSVSSKPYELSEKDLELIESDRQLLRSRQPKGPATSISVFGSGKLTGRRFVFLIDRSHSMGEQGLGVLKQARIELTNAINQLKDYHQFQIIVYHNSTATIARRELLPATEENKKLVPDFLQNVAAYGGTNHQNGIYAALIYDPDIIVMMTDGGSPDLHDGQISAIKKSANGTEIHTIQFESGAMTNSNHFLKRLADQTSGTFRYIDVRKWRKKN